jgi:four helix bundle protein
MNKPKSYQDLQVWQKAMDLVDRIYQVTKAFPKEELYGLSSQIRRAAISIPSNIAEGQGRSSTKEFLRHLAIAYGSLMETETQILISQRQGYVSPREAESLISLASEIGRMLNGLSAALSKKQTGH